MYSCLIGIDNRFILSHRDLKKDNIKESEKSARWVKTEITFEKLALLIPALWFGKGFKRAAVSHALTDCGLGPIAPKHS